MPLTQKQRQELRAQVRELLGDEVRNAAEAAMQDLTKHAGRGTDYQRQIVAGSAAGDAPTFRRGRELPHGAKVFARLGLVTALGQGDRAAMRDAARTLEIEQEFDKAQSAGSAEGGGLLISDDMADEVIELLRPRSVMRQIGAREIEIPAGSLRTPRIDSGATSAYVAEGKAIPSADIQTGQVVLTAKKLATLVILSNELSRFSREIDVDQVLLDDMLDSISQTEDDKFIFGEGTEAEPLGITNQVADAHSFDANATVNVANVVADLRTLMGRLTDNDVPMTRPVWIWSPRTSNFLRTLLNDNGQFVFRAEVDQGRLFGWSYFETNDIPNNLGDGEDESLIIVADAREVMLGDVRQVSIDRSSEATVNIDGEPTSLFETDRAAIRVRQWNDLQLRHDVGAAVMEAVTWGAA